jgi:hypothetical protein
MTPATRRRSTLADVAAALMGALLIAALSTLGDVVWFELALRHRPLYGLTHGTLLFAAVGFYLGMWSRRAAGGATGSPAPGAAGGAAGSPAPGAAGGAAIGLAAAGGYYLLAPLTGPAAMFVMWTLLWLAVAGLVEHLQGRRAFGGPAGIRGGLAALASGAAFYAISGIWTERPPPEGRNYFLHFASWTFAYVPAFLALLWRRENALRD